MTSGARVDTNSAWLSRRLGELGCDVHFHTTVGDDFQNNLNVFRNAIGRADVVVCTGGLGPTQDDLTREVLAQISGNELVRDDASMRHIEALFSKRGRDMPSRNEVQAMFPRGSRVIFNPQGTAPGIDIAIEVPNGVQGACDGSVYRSRVFALPGVPAEMTQMFDASVAPAIVGQMSDREGGPPVIRNHVMKFFGVGESDMEAKLGDMIARGRQPRVGITVSNATISLRITAMGTSESQCADQIQRTRVEILERAAEYYFGDGESFEQQDAIVAWLSDAKQTVAIVEIGRSAPLASYFSDAGGEGSFIGSLAMPSAESLQGRIGSGSIEAIWEQAARWFSCDWLIGVDQYPSLDDTHDGPLAAAKVSLIVVSPEKKTYRTEATLGGHPSIVHARIAKAAMQWFRKIATKQAV
jgi:nicotinamide-nucleotide amidase